MINVKIKLLALSSVAILASSSAMAANFNADQTKEIQQIVHDYLVQKPQVLIEASQALQKEQMSAMQKTADKAISANTKALFANAANPSVGNANGDVTVIEFMDYQCAHCKEMGPIMDTLVQGDGKIRVVYKELPIFGPTSEYAAKAAIASVKQGKYAAFHSALMKDQNPLTKDEVMKIAKSVGLNTDQLAKDAEDPAIAAQLKDNFNLAQALGLMGTPAIIIGDNEGKKTLFIPGTTSQQNMQQMIAQIRKG